MTAILNLLPSHFITSTITLPLAEPSPPSSLTILTTPTTLYLLNHIQTVKASSGKPIFTFFEFHQKLKS